MKLLKEHTEAGKVYGGTQSSVVILEKKGLLKVYTWLDDLGNMIRSLWYEVQPGCHLLLN